MKRHIATAALIVLAAACAEETRPPAATPSATSANPAALRTDEPYEPRIRAADFVDEIDNPYHPLIPGTTRRYEGESDGEKETNEIVVTDEKKEVLGVETTVVRDRVWVDDELAEETFDWFAQDEDGNVWYFGEDSREIEDGEIASREGSWEAGVDGAQPGIVMPGSPRVGEAYRQEYYEGEAEDEGKVIALDESITVPFGEFENVLVTEDKTPLEPENLERKYYARGIGVVKEELVRGGEEMLELVEVEPEP
jgi:hypothetical protein